MRFPRCALWRIAQAGLLALGLVVAGVKAAAAQPPPDQGPGQASVLTYHGHPDRSGRFVIPGLTWARASALRLDRAFAPRFSGHLYAQPLYWQPQGAASGILYVATENDTVAAINAVSGRALWRRRVGTPVPLADLPCGNIDPLGITGTPVINPTTRAIYFDAVSGDGGTMRHLIYALSLQTGAVLPGWPVDVAAVLAAQGRHFIARDQNQRGALAILSGRVFVPYGGHDGDCGDYHGWVVGVSLGNPSDVVSWRTRARGGGIWAPGGIASDGHSLYVATGNTFGAHHWSDGEAVIRLDSNLTRSDRPQDFFTPADWRALDARDLDLGGSNPLLFDVPSGSGGLRLVLALGKDRRAYALSRDNLGGIGGARAAATVAATQIITAPAVYPMPGGAFVAIEAQGRGCPSGNLTVVRITAGGPPAISIAWCAGLDGRGSPIVTTTDGSAEPIVWVLGAEGDGRLHGYRGDNGAPLYESPPLAGLRHFETLIAVPGRLYVGADSRLYAFDY